MDFRVQIYYVFVIKIYGANQLIGKDIPDLTDPVFRWTSCGGVSVPVSVGKRMLLRKLPVDQPDSGQLMKSLSRPTPAPLRSNILEMWR